MGSQALGDLAGSIVLQDESRLIASFSQDALFRIGTFRFLIIKAAPHFAPVDRVQSHMAVSLASSSSPDPSAPLKIIPRASRETAAQTSPTGSLLRYVVDGGKAPLCIPQRVFEVNG